MITEIDFENIFEIAPSWTSIAERQLLSSLAIEVPDKGLIVEIGCLYGGCTAVLALSNQQAQVISIDNFSWTPEGYPFASAERASNNLLKLGAQNFTIIEKTSRDASNNWDRLINLLWIDGGHSFDFVYFDLSFYSHFSNVIALHDYDNPAWSSIREAVEAFLSIDPYWYIDTIVDMVVVLRRK